MRAALIRESDGYVENVIEYDPNGNFEAPEGYALRELGDDEMVSPGWTRAGNGRLVAPPEPEPEPAEESAPE